MHNDMTISGSNEEVTLKNALGTLCKMADPGIMCGVRAISPGDESTLTQNEQAQMRNSAVLVRRASGAARIVARKILRDAGAPPPWDICKQVSGAPEWPSGFIGSISHDHDFALAAIAANQRLRSIGIDVERKIPLPAELISIVATKHEIDDLNNNNFDFKLLFCIKEAVYKATNVLDGEYLDHHDVEFSYKSNMATVRKRRQVKVHTITWPRFVALAIIE
jgi:4'-phosphopantetheinyl transferase EntD